MLGYGILALVYVAALAPLVVMLVLVLRRLQNEPKRVEIFEGLAASCLIAVCAALALTRGSGVQASLLAWLAFVVLCGIVIWTPKFPRLVDALACAAAPALVLTGALLAVYLLPAWLTGLFGAVASVENGQEAPSAIRALSFTLFVGIVSVPAIAVAILARRRVVEFAKSAYGANPTKFSRLEKVVNTVIRIGTSVAAVIVVMRH